MKRKIPNFMFRNKFNLKNVVAAAIFLAGMILSAASVTAQSSGTTIDMADNNPLENGTGWKYANNVYYILGKADVAITGTNANERRIEVAPNTNVNITLNNVSITGLSILQSPLLLNDSATVTLTLEGENTLTAGNYCAGIQAPEGTTLTINGTGRLVTTGGSGSAGIGGGELPEYIVVKNFINEIDFAIFGLDGLVYLYEFRDDNPALPKQLSIYDGNENKVKIIYTFDETGLPQYIIAEEFTIAMGKFEGNRFDAALVTKNGEAYSFENIESAINWDEHLNILSGGGIRLRSTSIDEKTVLKGVNVLLNGLACATGILSIPSGVGILLAAYGCTNYFISGFELADDLGIIDYNSPEFVNIIRNYGGNTFQSCSKLILEPNLLSAGGCLFNAGKTIVNSIGDIFNSKTEEIIRAEYILKTKIITIPQINTTLNGVTATTATVGINISNAGSPEYTERGICLSTVPNPTIANNRKIIAGTGIGSFSISISGLTANTTYYVRAYVITNNEIFYGNQQSFSTDLTRVSVIANPVTNKSSSSVTLNGSIVIAGDPAYTEKGFVYSSSSNPTTANNKRIVSGSGTGNFSTSISGFAANTVYYVRAYAIAAGITYYSGEVKFAVPTTSFENSRGGNVLIGGLLGEDPHRWQQTTSFNKEALLLEGYNRVTITVKLECACTSWALGSEGRVKVYSQSGVQWVNQKFSMGVFTGWLSKTITFDVPLTDFTANFAVDFVCSGSLTYNLGSRKVIVEAKK